MSQFRSIFSPWTTIFTDDNTVNGDFNPFSVWLPGIDIDELLFGCEVRNTTDASGIIRLGIQTANVEDTPDTPVIPTVPSNINTLTGNGVLFPDKIYDVSASTNAKRLVRFGYFFLASTATLRLARVCSQVQYRRK